MADPVTPEIWSRVGFRRSHRIDVYDKATMVLRDLRAGAWIIEGIPCDHPAVADLGPGGGIIAFYGDDVLFSGRVEDPSEVEGVNEQAAEVVDCSYPVGGPSDFAFVEDRSTHPSPADLDFTAAETRLYDGPAETQVKAVVGDNLGPAAYPGGANGPTRVQAGFTLAADLARGADVRDEVRLDRLGEVVAAWCIRGGIIPEVLPAAGELVFDIRVPVDRSRTVVFTFERHNVSRLVRSTGAPDANFVWVGGQGEGVARQFVRDQDADSMALWGFRRETVRDRRDTNDTAVLEAAAAEDIATMASNTAIEATPLPLDNLVYGTHYRLGDLVTARSRSGVTVTKQIREVTVTVQGDRTTFQPVLADPLTPAPGTPTVYGTVRNLNTRLVTQETR